MTEQLPPEHDIRVATIADCKMIAGILGSAFTNDPVLNWMTSASQIYHHFFLSELQALYVKHGHVYVNREQTGAAMWLPGGVPGKPPFHWRLLQVPVLMALNGGLGTLKRAGALEKAFADNHPKEPHFYLHVLGAALQQQGRGIGSALLKTGLKACDEQGLPAYLESSNIRNNPLYERHGFTIINETNLPENGPTIWFMWRDAR